MPAPTTAFNPGTGEQLQLMGGQWIPMPKGTTAQPTSTKSPALDSQQALALTGWGAPKVAYNPTTKKMLQLNPATNKWEPATRYAKVRADINQHPWHYLNPVEALQGVDETISQAFVSLAGQMNAIGAGMVGEAKAGYEKGATKPERKQAYQQAHDAYSKAWDSLYSETMKPETHWGWAINQAFSFLDPLFQAEHKAVLGATGSPKAADMATLFTGVGLFKANEITDKVKGVWNKATAGGAKPVQEGFDQYAEAHPEGAKEVAKKMTDAQIKKEMDAHIKEAEKRIKERMKPENYTQKKAAKDVVVTKEQLDTMMNPELRQQFEAQTAAHEQDVVAENLSKATTNVAPELMKTANMNPHDTLELARVFEQSILGGGKLHAALSPLTKEIWDEFSKRFLPAVNSDNQLIHPTQEGTANFWKNWVSKGYEPVSDKFGRPQTFYNAMYNIEEPDMAAGKVTYASDNPLVSGSYVGDPRIYGREPHPTYDAPLPKAHVNKLYAAFKNPLVVDAKGKPYNQIPWQGHQWTTDMIVKAAKKAGHDGVIFRSVVDDAGGEATGHPSTVIAAIGPGTIKSAMGNTGLWSHEYHWMHQVVGPVSKDLIQKVLEAVPGAGLGPQDNPTVKQALAGSKYTLKTLERLPEKPMLTKAQVSEQMARADVTQVEKDVLNSVLEAAPGENISAKDLVKGFQIATNTMELKPEDTEQYAHYGLNNIVDTDYLEALGEVSTTKSTVWQLPFELQSQNHFSDPKYFAHTREFEEGGTPHVVEIQSDAAQHTRGYSPEQVKMLQDNLASVKQHYTKLTKELETAQREGVTFDRNLQDINHDLEKASLHIHEVEAKLASGQAATKVAPMIKHWYRRIIGEVLARAAKKGKKSVRFATADTVAKVEGWPKTAEEIASIESSIRNHKASLRSAKQDQEAWQRAYDRLEEPTAKENAMRYIRSAQDRAAESTRFISEYEANVQELRKSPPMRSKEHQSIYDRYNTEIAGHLRKLGGHNYTDPQGHTWIEVPTEKFLDKRIDMFGTTMMYSALTPLNEGSMKAVRELLKKIPGYQVAEEKTRIAAQEALATFYPEGLGDRAEQAAAVIAKGLAVESHLKQLVMTNDKAHEAYWEGKPEDYRLKWLMDWEEGKTPKDAQEARALEQYKARNEAAHQSDIAHGVKEYAPIDNYIYHLFENGPAVNDYLTKKYGVKWGDPKFTKERQFRMIRDAYDAGFRLKTTSPIALVQAREFASLVAALRTNMLEELTRGGMAIRKQGSMTMPAGMVPRRSPSGGIYYLYPEVAQVVHNAFDSRSLWSNPGTLGMAYRSWMYLKNHTVPVILSLSAFHPLHIGLGMDAASELTRISQEFAAGVTSAAESVPRAAKALAIIPGQYERSYKGFRMLRVLSGEEKNPTPEERTALNYMLRGGFIPFNTQEFNTGALKQLRGAIKRNAYITAGWKLPWAMLEAIGWPIYQKWIPALKTANYLDDVASAIKSDPGLMEDEARMNVRLNKIRKSVEDRFGQMSYKTLFWNRWVKDIMQAMTLSLGWKLGFVRQFLGQPFETMKAVGKVLTGTSPRELVAKGELNKTMFVGYYVMMAAGLSGLMTYMFTGTPPQGKDWNMPRIGGKNPDGTARRVNTMFYTREYASFGNHVQNEGLGKGLTQYAINSAAPNFKIANEFYTGLDYRNHEIYDPDSPEWKQLVQKTAAVLGDLDPISVETYKRTGDTKGTVLGILGFTPAPKYMTESPIEGKIKRMAGYYNQHITPFEKAQYSDEVVALHNAARSGDEAGYQKSLETLATKYKLSSDDMAKLQKNSHVDPMIAMFKHLTSKQQVRLLKDMTPEEKQKYIRAAHNDAKRQLLQEQGE